MATVDFKSAAGKKDAASAVMYDHTSTSWQGKDFEGRIWDKSKIASQREGAPCRQYETFPRCKGEALLHAFDRKAASAAHHRIAFDLPSLVVEPHRPIASRVKACCQVTLRLQQGQNVGKRIHSNSRTIAK